MVKKIIDLFSGAGGLTEGFRNEYFEVIGHVEKEEAASKTLQLRDAYYYLKSHKKTDQYYQFLSGEITETQLLNQIPQKILNKTINKTIGDETIQEIFKQFDLSLADGTSVAGVIGGPPCQAYSTIGRALNAPKKSTDIRIYLYRYYIDFLKHYRPNFFVFENVKGLLSFKDVDGNYLLRRQNGTLTGNMYDEFRDAGYELDYRIVNTKEYGIPQARERIIIFGTPKTKSNIIEPFFNELSKLKEPPINLDDALNDLPTLKAGQELNHYSASPSDYIRKYFRHDDNLPLTQNLARPNIKRDLDIYKIVLQSKIKGHNLKYNELPSNLQTHRNTDKFLDRYKALVWDQPSHTIVAHIAKDGHHYIHPDVKQNRSITVREAARIQGFPDDFYFETSRTQAFTQIGNAVPPILSEKISEAIQKIKL
ncbi:DNA cytosine methyltransferase [Leuconostoc mesenteroides]|uniref:DNA cytosine methyltransferase n=1 Tax=Leuconostoc mesenteroides TaxID=1245 RepID=UPI00311EEF80